MSICFIQLLILGQLKPQCECCNLPPVASLCNTSAIDPLMLGWLVEDLISRPNQSLVWSDRGSSIENMFK